jgi:hypothetical protein
VDYSKWAVLSGLLVLGKGEACERQLELWWLKVGSGPICGCSCAAYVLAGLHSGGLGLLEILPGRAWWGRSPGAGGWMTGAGVDWCESM